jgi:hypothetical protein
MTARWMQSTVGTVEGLDRQTARKVDQGGLLHPARGGRDGALQLRREQPEGAAHHARERRREPAGRPRQPARRPGARQGAARHRDDRLRRLPPRRERGGDAGQGDLSEPADAARPVRAGHRDGVSAAAPDRAAVDQQVLYPRPQAPELVHQVGGGPGPQRVRHLLGQPGRGAGAQELRRLPAGRAVGGTRRHHATASAARSPPPCSPTWPAWATPG